MKHIIRESQIKLVERKKSSYKIFEAGTYGSGNFGIKVPALGKKTRQPPITFIFRFFLNNKLHLITIGKSPAFRVDEARKIARSYSDMLKQGLNPKDVIIEKEKQKQAALEEMAAAQRYEEQQADFEYLINSYIDNLRATGKRSADKIHKALISDVYPIIPPATKVNQVKPDDIRKALTVMINRGAPVQSNRIRTYLLAAFNYALRYDFDSGGSPDICAVDLS